MLFGTAKRMAASPKSLEVKYQDNIINATTSYKYLGVKLDSTMTMQEHFNSRCEKASSQLTLLSKLRYFITEKTAKTIYQLIVLPVVTYCCLVNLKMTETQSKRLESLENPSQKVINGNTHIIKIQD